MSIELAVGVYLAVHTLGLYLLRASGTWTILFAPVLNLAPDKTPDPLRVAPRGWIENHSFWDLATDTDNLEDAQEDHEQVFWGTRQRNAG